MPLWQAADEDEEEEEEDEERAEERQPGRSASLPASPSAPAGSASEADSLEAQLAAVRAQAKAMATVRANSSMLNGAVRPFSRTIFSHGVSRWSEKLPHPRPCRRQ